jgi:succinate dehydrogenase / fumarate reductase cytochrome b subunit
VIALVLISAATHDFIASLIGVLLLFGWSVAFFYHLCSGIRHLAWDAGYGFDIRMPIAPATPC